MSVLFLVKADSAEAGRDLRQKALVGIFGGIIGFVISVIGGGGVMHPLPEGGAELVPVGKGKGKGKIVCPAGVARDEQGIYSPFPELCLQRRQ